MLTRISSWCFHQRWATVGLWILLLVGSNIAAGIVGIEYSNSFGLPGTDSQEAFDLLNERFPEQAGDTADLVIKAEAGLDDDETRAELAAVFAEIEAIDGIVSIASPYDADPFGPPQISDDGTIAFAKVQFDGEAGDIDLPVIKKAAEIARDAERDGLEVVLGGLIVQAAEDTEAGLTEILGLAAAVIILLIIFGSILAMSLPLVVALFGIVTGSAILTLLSHVLSTPEFAPQMAGMVGIGVGIDYALFIVTRQRQGLHEGLSPAAANRVAMATAGRAVLFAGATVVVALLGMLLTGFEFIEGLAVGMSAVVLMTMLSSVTLLPALLGFTGTNIDRWGIKRLTSQESGAEGTMWWRWSRSVQSRPLLWASLSLTLLLVLSAPLLSMRLGLADAGNDPEGTGTRRSYDMLAEGFGPGFNGPFLVAAAIDEPSDAAVLEDLTAHLATVDGVAGVSPPVLSPDGTAAIISVVPLTSPQDEATDALVRQLRNVEIPAITDGTGVEVHLGGFTALFTDFTERISERLPLVIGAVIFVSFLLLMVVFRSVLVPLKAAIMNLLSISAAYGVIVAIFQWGWGLELLGLEQTGPIEAWVPMMLFAILFGLSMDYEVFLLSRIREEYNEHGDNALAVANGLARTARVITAAAAIMITVFLVFALGVDFRGVKLFAIGLATAILVDATIVRMVLVPSTMELLGDANWWLPGWLDKILPHVSIDDDAISADPQDAAV